jgi:hypothetical protein
MPYDAIVVPGGGSQRGERCDTLPPWVLRRLDAAATVYKEAAAAASDGEAPPIIVVLSAGTTHRPNFVAPNGWPVLEATSAAYYLIGRHGVPAAHVQRETTSLDTIGNAYFARAQILEPAGLRRLLVITSQFHMPRTEAIFRFVLGAAAGGGGSAADPFELEFLAVSDGGLDPLLIGPRAEREAQSLANFDGKVVPMLRERSASGGAPLLRVLQRWLFTEHTAYCTHADMTPTAAALPQSVLDTY